MAAMTKVSHCLPCANYPGTLAPVICQRPGFFAARLRRNAASLRQPRELQPCCPSNDQCQSKTEWHRVVVIWNLRPGQTNTEVWLLPLEVEAERVRSSWRGTAKIVATLDEVRPCNRGQAKSTSIVFELIFMSMGGPQAHAKLLPNRYVRVPRHSARISTTSP